MAETNTNHAPVAASLNLDDEIWEAYGKNHSRTSKNCGHYMMYNRGFKDGAAYRRTPPAEVSADGMPTLDKLPPFPEKKAGYLEQGANGVFLAYSWNPAAETRALFTEDQYRQGQRDAIAPYAEQIKKLERELAAAREVGKHLFTAVADQGELAERKQVQTIDSNEFRDLLAKYASSTFCGFGEAEAKAALIAYIDGRPAGTAPADPMDWPLPCDVTTGAVTIRKGCKLRTLVTRMESLHRMATAALPTVTQEQKDANWKALMDAAAPSPSTGTGESK